MNIKQAKDEIRHTVQAYLTKDALGDYAIPVVRQRPILLIGPQESHNLPMHLLSGKPERYA